MMQRRPDILSIEGIAAVSVRLAASAALTRMGIKVDSTEKTESGELVKASTASRRIEIELESTTRQRYPHACHSEERGAALRQSHRNRNYPADGKADMNTLRSPYWVRCN